MALIYFIKGLLLGFAIAAPVGPIGILCIRRTLQYGRFSGLFSGFGAATADTIYGCIAAFSLTLVSDFLITYKLWFHFLGGIFLIALGTKTFYADSIDDEDSKVSHRSLLSDYFSTLFLTLSNPLTIFSFIAVFAALGLVNVSDKFIDAASVVVGIFSGSSLWWLLLSEGMTLFRRKVTNKTMTWINRTSGIIIVSFGIIALLTILHLHLT